MNHPEQPKTIEHLTPSQKPPFPSDLPPEIELILIEKPIKIFSFNDRAKPPPLPSPLPLLISWDETLPYPM
jgi:hypothetical protein